jgi:hypothetical protein
MQRFGLQLAPPDHSAQATVLRCTSFSAFCAVDALDD